MADADDSMTANGAGAGRAALVEGDVEFDDDDAELLRTIARTGSIAAAAGDLERSRARATWRIEALEEAFGPLVERHRGGDGGGGSRLTEDARSLLDRYDRLAVALDATARVPETVLSGTVSGVDGELATVATEIGEIEGVHDALSMDDDVQVRIGADAITLHEPDGSADPDASSARNRRDGRVVKVDRGETVSTVVVAVDGARFRTLVTDESANRLDLEEGRPVTVAWKATATRLVAEGPVGQDGL